jgi:hypothetical protein
MKNITKVMIAATTAALLTTSASADDLKLGSVQLGAASSSIGSGPSDTGGYFGADFFLPVTLDNIGVGVGFDMMRIGDSIGSQGTSDSYTMGAQLKVAYSLKDIVRWNANIKAELGYGLTYLGNTDETGMQYGIGANVQVYKNFGVGYKYKVVDTGIVGLDDLEAHIGYLQFTW